ncbi:MAG: MBOAT family protein [Rhodocyclaceae bacterium]|nr:MBOAT family protein [Rhodocyclaceae bacterium]
MLFNSYIFIFGYLPVTFAGFFLLARSSHRWAALWLAVASLFFYGWWNPLFVLLVMASITVNYAFGYAIGHARLISLLQAKTVLTVSVVANLGLLAYFKYADFFIANLSRLTGMEMTVVNILLPLGISFFTFTQIAFLVDVYRGIAREYSFIHYVLFVTYFPHLIAGPVLHHKQMMPQFGHAETYRINLENINVGITIFIIGLAKKVLLADQFAMYANPVFDVVAHGGEPKLIEAWIGALAYTLQLYFDFSGYSDMAIGLSRMFNVKLPPNFDSPYKAQNIIEFWRRWHMTLSAFLRDYLYVPLGGNRKGLLRRYVNLMTTMLLGGLWHGAGWTFVLWGGLHGLYLVINHGWRWLIGDKASSSCWRALTGVGLTFVAVVIAWVPFRAADLDAALRMWAGLFGVNGISLPPGLESMFAQGFIQFAFDGLAPLAGLSASEVIPWLWFGLMVIWLLPNSYQWTAKYRPVSDALHASARWTWKFSTRFAVLGGVLLALSLLSLTRESAFLYFQF